VRLAVVNGPNLNLLGTREPALYGRETLADVEAMVSSAARSLDVEVEFLQRSSEGDLIDFVHGLAGRVDGAVVNAGAYSHTSLALRDAFAAVGVPFVEVHVTNVHAREPERHHSMLAPVAVGLVTGLGAYGYELAFRGLVAHLKQRAS
jgi:3-dehydroquinate dehydratase-2